MVKADPKPLGNVGEYVTLCDEKLNFRTRAFPVAAMTFARAASCLGGFQGEVEVRFDAQEDLKIYRFATLRLTVRLTERCCCRAACKMLMGYWYYYDWW